MRKFMSIFLAAVMFFSFASFAFSENLETVVAKFYNDIAGIIENNMNNSSQCVSQVRAYLETNQDILAKVRQFDELGKKRAASGKRANISQEQAFKALSESPAANAMFRFSEALSNFSVEYSDEASQIAQMLK